MYPTSYRIHFALILCKRDNHRAAADFAVVINLAGSFSGRRQRHGEYFKAGWAGDFVDVHEGGYVASGERRLRKVPFAAEISLFPPLKPAGKSLV